MSKYRKRTRTEVALKRSGDVLELSQPLKLFACRFVQATLINAFKHAGGRGEQKVETICKDGAFSIRMSDGGPGIAATARGGKRQTLGLAGLRNRLESLGGEMEVTNNHGGGATVIATFFLKQLENG